MSAPRTPQCDAVLAALAAGPLPPELQAHAQSCPHCRPELAAHAALSRLRPPPPTEALRRAQTLAHAALRVQPRARAWWWSTLGLVALNLAVGVASAVMLLNQRVSTHAHPAPTSTLWAVALLLLALLAAGPLLSFAPTRRGALGAGLLMAGVVAVGVSVGSSPGGDVRPYFSVPGVGCMTAEVLVSLLPLAATLWLLTMLPARPLRTLLATLSAAAAGLLGLHLSCPVGTAQHILAFHVLPWLALGGIAFAVRARLRTRAYAP
jgi:hypothetical protein